MQPKLSILSYQSAMHRAEIAATETKVHFMCTGLSVRLEVRHRTPPETHLPSLDQP